MDLGLFQPFLKSKNWAKIVQKVKDNPLPFWSILPNFLTVWKQFKNQCKILWSHFKAFLECSKAFFNRFWKVQKWAKIVQKVKANPLPFWSILANISIF